MLLIVKSRVKNRSVLKRIGILKPELLKVMKLECTCIDERALKLQKERS